MRQIIKLERKKKVEVKSQSACGLQMQSCCCLVDVGHSRIISVDRRRGVDLIGLALGRVCLVVACGRIRLQVSGFSVQPKSDRGQTKFVHVMAERNKDFM